MAVKRTVRRIIMVFILFCTLIPFNARAEDTDLRIKRVGQIISYRKNVFSVDTPEAGLLRITIRNDTDVFRVLEENVHEGTTTIEWDGCGFNRERLAIQNYHIEGDLTGYSGKEYHISFNSPVEYSGQALEFALSSGETAYLDEPDEWFLEAKTVLTGTLVIKCRSEASEDSVWTARKPISAGKISRLTLRQIFGKNIPEAGLYRVEVYEVSVPENTISFSLTIQEGIPEQKPVAITGEIMPKRGATDQEIWEAMMRPSVVADIDFTEHQEVYRLPDNSTEVLGTLHGQTQCLSLWEIRDDWARVGAWNHEEGEYMEGWVPLNRLKTVYPRGEYGLLLDKKEQTLSVYHNGEKIDTLLVSTGRMEKDEYEQETAAGCFLTGYHRVDFSTQGQKYDFVIQYDGGNLLHQIPYAWGGKKDFTQSRALLGAKGSHACIRIQAKPGTTGGINAYWIWTHVPYHSRLIILDDPEERHKEKAILSGEAMEYEDSGISGGAELRKTGKENIRITFGGDTVLGGRESYYSRRDSLMYLVELNGMGYPFDAIHSLTEQDDWTCINLECVLKETKEGENKKKEWRFRGLPEYSKILKAGSIEMVNLANNHTADYGDAGYESTVRSVEGVTEWVGKDHPCSVLIHGHLIGFGSCRETEYLNDPDIISKDIEILKKMKCEAIIYQCHWGKEYDPHHSALQEAMARACERAGADLVIGHHPHVVQGMDFINRMPVLYSLGNLSFGGTIDLKTYDGIMVQATFCVTEEGLYPEIELIPILTSGTAEERKNNFQPVIALEGDRKRILDAVQADTPFPITDYTDIVQ